MGYSTVSSKFDEAIVTNRGGNRCSGRRIETARLYFSASLMASRALSAGTWDPNPIFVGGFPLRANCTWTLTSPASTNSSSLLYWAATTTSTRLIDGISEDSAPLSVTAKNRHAAAARRHPVLRVLPCMEGESWRSRAARLYGNLLLLCA